MNSIENDLVSTGSPLSEPSRFPDAITKSLIKSIESDVYPPGSKVPATKLLAESFKVSTPIVREALSMLKYDGYIEPRQGSGVYVKDRNLAPPSLRLNMDAQLYNPELLAEVFEVRLLVEQSCAGLAAQRRTPQDVLGLRQALDDILDAMSQGQDASDADVRFHLAVAAATHNASLHRLTNFLHSTLHDSVRTARRNSNRTPGMSTHAEAEHQAIFAAIRDQQPDAARQAMRLHLEGATRRLNLPSIPGNTAAVF